MATVIHEGKQYQTVRRGPRVGDLVLYESSGRIATVISDSDADKGVHKGSSTTFLGTARGHRATVLEPYDSSDRIATLEATVKSLAERVEALEKRSVVDVAKRGEQLVHAAIKRREQSLTRADVVEMAKRDVEELQKTSKHQPTPYYLFDIFCCDAQFIVNRRKRTVVAVLRWRYNSEFKSRGIAKSAPDDCFNVHIGKAIALRRALGLDVPNEYVNAPKPTNMDVCGGDLIRYPNGNTFYVVDPTDGNVTVRLVSWKVSWSDDDIGKEVSSSVRLREHKFTILDDSHDFGGEGN